MDRLMTILESLLGKSSVAEGIRCQWAIALTTSQSSMRMYMSDSRPMQAMRAPIRRLAFVRAGCAHSTSKPKHWVDGSASRAGNAPYARVSATSWI